MTANDNVYLIGGVKANTESVETVWFLTVYSPSLTFLLSVQVLLLSFFCLVSQVEVYNERQGWSVPGYKAIGQRRFASAIVF